MDAFKGTKAFDGTGDVNKFIAKMEVVISLKGLEDEQQAQALASKLEDKAFDVYLRMSAEDRKNVETLKGELRKEFEVGQADREKAVAEL